MIRFLLIVGFVALLMGLGLYALAQVQDNNQNDIIQDIKPFNIAPFNSSNQDTTGACCLPDESCQVLDSLYCVTQGGRFEGYGTHCGGDTDGDGKADRCDSCPYDSENDIDGDGVCGDVDNCPEVANPDQSDSDGDSLGNACDSCPYDSENDIDGDGVCGDVDNCPYDYNPGQEDADKDNVGDVCDTVSLCMLDVDEPSFDLGDVRVCNPAVDQMTVTNVGTVAGAVTIVVTGCASADPTSFELGVDESQLVDVDCHPTAEGSCTGTLELTCDGGDPTVVEVTCNGVCSHVETNCPLDFGDVTIVDTMSMDLEITSTGTADLNVSAITINDSDFSVGALPGPIAPGGSGTVTITVAPSAATGPGTASAIIVSDACEGDVTCGLTVNKQPPPVTLTFEPGCQVIIPHLAFEIQVIIGGILSDLPVSSIYFEICTDTCIAYFDSSSVAIEAGQSVLYDMEWTVSVQYSSSMCLQVWLNGVEPLMENGVLVNIGLVPNGECIINSGWECGDDSTDIWLADALVNEGDRDVVTEDAEAIINSGPEWEQDNYVMVAREGCIDYGCPPVEGTFVDVDTDGDTMVVYRIPDVAWGNFIDNPAIAPQTIDTVWTKGSNPFECGDPSTLEWLWEWNPNPESLNWYGIEAPKTWTDTIVTRDPDTDYPRVGECYDAAIIHWILTSAQRGDINMDGSINILDVLAVVNHILGKIPLEGLAHYLADCNGDGDVNILDAIAIVRNILGEGECQP